MAALKGALAKGFAQSRMTLAGIIGIGVRASGTFPAT